MQALSEQVFLTDAGLESLAAHVKVVSAQLQRFRDDFDERLARLAKAVGAADTAGATRENGTAAGVDAWKAALSEENGTRLADQAKLQLELDRLRAELEAERRERSGAPPASGELREALGEERKTRLTDQAKLQLELDRIRAELEAERRERSGAHSASGELRGALVEEKKTRLADQAKLQLKLDSLLVELEAERRERLAASSANCEWRGALIEETDCRLADQAKLQLQLEAPRGELEKGRSSAEEAKLPFEFDGFRRELEELRRECASFAGGVPERFDAAAKEQQAALGEEKIRRLAEQAELRKDVEHLRAALGAELRREVEQLRTALVAAATTNAPQAASDGAAGRAEAADTADAVGLREELARLGADLDGLFAGLQSEAAQRNAAAVSLETAVRELREEAQDRDIAFTKALAQRASREEVRQDISAGCARLSQDLEEKLEASQGAQEESTATDCSRLSPEFEAGVESAQSFIQPFEDKLQSAQLSTLASLAVLESKQEAAQVRLAELEAEAKAKAAAAEHQPAEALTAAIHRCCGDQLLSLSSRVMAMEEVGRAAAAPEEPPPGTAALALEERLLDRMRSLDARQERDAAHLAKVLEGVVGGAGHDGTLASIAERVECLAAAQAQVEEDLARLRAEDGLGRSRRRSPRAAADGQRRHASPLPPAVLLGASAGKGGASGGGSGVAARSPSPAGGPRRLVQGGSSQITASTPILSLRAPPGVSPATPAAAAPAVTLPTSAPVPAPAALQVSASFAVMSPRDQAQALARLGGMPAAAAAAVAVATAVASGSERAPRSPGWSLRLNAGGLQSLPPAAAPAAALTAPTAVAPLATSPSNATARRQTLAAGHLVPGASPQTVRAGGLSQSPPPAAGTAASPWLAARRGAPVRPGGIAGGVAAAEGFGAQRLSFSGPSPPIAFPQGITTAPSTPTAWSRSLGVAG